MFYKYKFVENQRFAKLNKHFLFFIRKIRNVSSKSKFIPRHYFHPSFLNANGMIAPNGKISDKLSEKFKAFFDVFKKLDDDKKKEFYFLIILAQDINLYFEDVSKTEVINLKASNIKTLLNNSDVFKELMDALWLSLKSKNAWEIDNHYEEFYEKLPESKMCPFCGLKKMNNYELGREDYDHIAFKGNYPISAIINKNLAPTCDKCNQDFKKAKDVLFKSDKKSRRVFMYPFTFNSTFLNQNINIDFVGSIHPEIDLNNYKGKWKINISPDTDFTKSWNYVYGIKKRYSLAVDYRTWQDELISAARINRNNINKSVLINYIKEYKKTFNPNKLRDQYHIKYAYYDFLEKSMNDALFNQINSISA